MVSSVPLASRERHSRVLSRRDGTIGVLALQGDFAAHLAALGRLGLEGREVRRPEEARSIAALIVPGGESTTLLRQFDYEPRWWQVLADLAAAGLPILGTCAGLILLAKEVRPEQASLGLLDVTVERNAYGRQIDSFCGQGVWTSESPRSGASLEMVLIRAPRILRVANRVEVLAKLRSEPVLVRQGNVYGASFHPELGKDLSVMELLLKLLLSKPGAH